MSVLKRIKRNFNKVLLKTTSLVVIGAFLFISLAWGNSKRAAVPAAVGIDTAPLSPSLSRRLITLRLKKGQMANGKWQIKDLLRPMAAEEEKRFPGLQAVNRQAGEAFAEGLLGNKGLKMAERRMLYLMYILEQEPTIAANGFTAKELNKSLRDKGLLPVSLFPYKDETSLYKEVCRVLNFASSTGRLGRKQTGGRGEYLCLL